jgi:hypothetical protein
LKRSVKFYQLNSYTLVDIPSNRQNRIWWNKIKWDSELSDWGATEYGLPQQTILRPLLLIMYIRNLPQINTSSEPVPLADDTNVTISHTNSDYYCSMWQIFLSLLTKWFTTNNFTLNLHMTNIQV